MADELTVAAGEDSMQVEESGTTLESSSSNAGPERGEIWLDDGNIILIAQETAFRVHRSVLSRNSDVFRDILTVPQPADAEMLDGLPVVRLSDSKRDVVHLLRALYDGGHAYAAYGDPLPFCAVSAMLRLGTKYQVEFLKQAALVRLKKVFPTSLKDFRNLFTEWDDFFTAPSGPPPPGNTAVKLSPQDAIAAVKLSQMFDIPQILPAALYICAQLRPQALVHGYKDEEGNSWKLSPPELLRCLEGQAKLRGVMPQLTRFILIGNPSTNCPCKAECMQQLSTTRLQFLKPGIISRGNILLGPKWIENLDICKPCKDSFLAYYCTTRERIWNHFPNYFGLQWPQETPAAPLPPEPQAQA